MTDDIKFKGKGIHVGVIPDGNRRYAIKKNEPPWKGHWYGAEKTGEFINWCATKPEIKMISIFALSTENLKRSGKETSELWKVYKNKFLELLDHPRVKNDVVGELIKSTKNYSKYVLNFLLAYGSKFEINDAIKKMVGKPAQTLDRALLIKKPLNLVIRTGDQYRLSNFMLYQASYANIYFEKKLWPDVTKRDFEKWIKWYHEQENKFGK